MGDRYERSDINGISTGVSIWDMGYRFGLRYSDMVIYHIDMVILDIDMGYGLMMWEMTVTIRSSPIWIWDILSLCGRALFGGMIYGGMLARKTNPLYWCQLHKLVWARQGLTLVHFSAQLKRILSDRGAFWDCLGGF